MKPISDVSLDVFAESLQDEGDTPFLLKNVKVCGLVSANGRQYPEKVLAEAVQAGLYTNVPLCVETENHKDNVKSPGKHGYADRLGCIVNPVLRPGYGVFGDANLNPKHPLAEAVAWDYRNRTKGVGLSQTGFFQLDASGRTILSVAEIKTVDVVINPATTVSLVESDQDEPEDKEAGKDEQKVDESTTDEMGERLDKMLAHPKFVEYMKNFADGMKTEVKAESLQLADVRTALSEVLKEQTPAIKPRSASPIVDMPVNVQKPHWAEYTKDAPVKYKQ